MPGRRVRVTPTNLDASPDRTRDWSGVRFAMALLARDDEMTTDDWRALLEAAVAEVPGAEVGSINVRDGDQFTIRAQCGFDDALVGLSQTLEATIAWHGSEPAWRAGQATVLPHHDIVARSRQASEINGSLDQHEVFQQAGRIVELRCTLCLPVMLNGQVVAHLNLDSLTSESAFGPHSVRVAEEFAAAMAALLAARERRVREAQRRRELEVLSELSAALHLAVEADDVERILCEEAARLVGTVYTSFFRYELLTDDLRLSRTHNFEMPPLALPRGTGVTWRALLEDRVLHVEDIHQDSRVFRPDLYSVQTLVAAPLRTSDGEPLGVLVLARDPGSGFSEHELRLCRAVAETGANALERARGARTLRDRAHELEATREGALLALGLALEARDFETHGHTQRVVALAQALGRALGLDCAQLDALRQGAYLHDIGKLTIPDAILLKPGRLEEKEWHLMQDHAARGYDLARHVHALPDAALDVIRSHHERWDGQGYPDARKAEDIPLLARIFAVCDVYDALTSERPYKRAWTREEAVAEIAAQAGRQFDPRVVRAFLPIAPVPVDAPAAAAD